MLEDIWALARSARAGKKSSKNGIIIVGIIAAITAGVGYGAVSGAFSSLSAKARQSAPIIMHIHPHLRIMIEGNSVTIPMNTGIDPSLWNYHDLDSYGMKKMPNMPSMTGMAPLHTHDTSGTIHVESTVVRDFTLGEFFDVWGVTFSDTCIMDKCNAGIETVKMFVNGQPSTEFRNHILKDGEQILIRYD